MAKTLQKNTENSTFLIPRIPMFSSQQDFPVIFKRLQFPVIVAYYLTFYRAQGQSDDLLTNVV